MIKVGDLVRSYDFPHDRKCYIEGVVDAFTEKEGCERYMLRVLRKVWIGEEVADPIRDREYVYPPVNGTPKLFGGVTDFVELVS